MNEIRPRRVVVVGGGLSGLAFAHALEAACGDRIEVTILERGASLGGTVQTESTSGFLVESGADGWVANETHATDLAKRVGLADDLVETIASNRRVYIAWKNRLVRVPAGMVLAVPTRARAILASPLFSLRGKMRIALEAAIPARAWNGDDDESIAEFATRRFGAELTERLAAPLLGGIVSGEASDLSIRATFPQLVDAEKMHGSLIVAMRSRRQAPGAIPPSAFVSLRRGMGTFATAIGASLRHARVRTSVAVRAIAKLAADDARGSYVVELENGEALHADAVVVAAPIGSATTLLGPIDPAIARALGAIEEVTATIATLAFRRDQIDHALDATGFLLPRVSGRPLVASTFVSSKWEGRTPAGHALLRAFLRSVDDVDLARADDDRVARIASDELARVLSIRGAPIFSRVVRVRRPHLRVGHLVRIRAIREALARQPSLYLLGSGVDGVGIPDCVRAATETARAVAASLASPA